MRVDAATFPRTAAYLARLPEGIESHPRARIRTEVHEGLRSLLAGASLDLPEPLGAFVDGRYREEWMPQVMANALLLVARDRIWTEDEDFYAFLDQNLAALLQKPLYRMVLRMMSPQLVIASAARRWQLVHEGTVLEAAELQDTGEGWIWAPLVLMHPPHLWDDLHLRGMCAAFESSLRACRAEAPRVRAEPRSPEEAWFHVRWRSARRRPVRRA